MRSTRDGAETPTIRAKKAAAQRLQWFVLPVAPRTPPAAGSPKLNVAFAVVTVIPKRSDASAGLRQTPALVAVREGLATPVLMIIAEACIQARGPDVWHREVVQRSAARRAGRAD